MNIGEFFKRWKWITYRDKSDILNLLLDISQSVNNRELEEIFGLVLEKLKEFYHAQNCCIHLLDEDEMREVVIKKARTYCPGMNVKPSEMKRITEIEKTFNRRAMESGETKTFEGSMGGTEEFGEFKRSLKIEDEVTIPLIYQSVPFGVLNIYFGRGSNLEAIDEGAPRMLGNIIYGAVKKEVHIRELEEYEDVMCAFAKAVGAKNKYTGDHVERVVKCAMELGEAVGLGEEELKGLKMAAMLHDIGKIGILA